ncbi:MerR family transcriptional regulator [Nannocystis sp.]|uniref:MerR family transcriptional regulator n=1 Tax=Nannocystis sp. TaxID=1962667 RepID=UPI00242602A5|nr:MerR family transcriptional regulator [Nannocystis sp.]MBK7826848.1 MerR family transcriptional regulator [Nannocystis sp.]MBK9758356.1 MerR family transcriptional regulator [Nannocystis sp.]
MASKRGGLLTLKEMTEGSGCTPRTVRYYEREGLLQAARSSGGHRQFPPGELDRLNFILALREAGWSLEEITALLAVREQTRPDHHACRQLESMVSGHIAQLEHKIGLLNRLRDDLQATRQALAVCDGCTETPGKAITCEACTRLPALDALPQGFRNSWRGVEARAAPPRPRSLHVVGR